MTGRTTSNRDARELRKATGVFRADPVRLVYVSDAMPGIRRVRKGKGFAYRDPEGKPLADAAELARIRRLAVPPAYRDVWICPLADGHLQATGRDARGRKQYRYHAQWSEERGAGKFERLQAFGRALPAIRRRVARDLRPAAAGTGVSREMVLATIVSLLDTTFLRVGNEAYARENGSYGLTTLRNPHAGVSGDTLRLRFKGKSGVQHEARVRDPRIARIVRRCQQLPGQELFSWQDADGKVCPVGSGDVNDYLAEAAGSRFTAKDFRTWHGTVHALQLVQDGVKAGGTTARAVLEDVARMLGNTPAVCRKSYVHPGVLALLEPQAPPLATAAATPPARGLKPAERQLMSFLRRLKRAAPAKMNATIESPTNGMLPAVAPRHRRISS